MSDERYSRQILFPGIGPEGQARIAASRVLLVGCGALGSVVAEVLVRAGVGRLTIADRDYVDESNLQRQSLYTEADAREGLPKAAAAVRRLRELNSSVELVERVVDVRAETIEALISGNHIILDGTDNFEARYLLNDASLRWNVPWVYGACVGAYGICMAVIPGVTPCLRCVLNQLPSPGTSPTCDTAGVIGPIVHLVAAFESAEALKILTGRTDQVSRNLVTVDLWDNRFAAMDVRDQRDPACPACASRNYEFLNGAGESRAYSLCGRNAVQIQVRARAPVDLEGIAGRLAGVCHVTCNAYLLRADLGDREVAVFRDGRGIIRGTQDVDEARRIYSKFIGN